MLVIGGGVAELSAIGTARNVGAIVRVFDTRPAVAEQVGGAATGWAAHAAFEPLHPGAHLHVP